MKEAAIIYPHQLFEDNPVLSKERIIYLVEEPLLMGEFPIHRQKMMFHRLSMKAYGENLQARGYEIVHLKREELENTQEVFREITANGSNHLHIMDTTDYWLEKRISEYVDKHQILLTRYESKLFFLSKQEAIDRFLESKKHMARFYKKMRIDKNILMQGPGQCPQTCRF